MHLHCPCFTGQVREAQLAQYNYMILSCLRNSLLNPHLDPWWRQVREAQLAQYNYILVVGEQEAAQRTVNVRTRDNVVHGMYHVRTPRMHPASVFTGLGCFQIREATACPPLRAAPATCMVGCRISGAGFQSFALI